MTTPAAPLSTTGSLRRAGWLLAAAVLAVYFFAPASAVLDVTLDASNYGTYASFTAEGRQYGADVLPMAGPFGFILYGWTYAGQLYWTRFALELLVKFAFALLVIWQFRETAGRRIRWLWLATLLLIPHGATEVVYDLTVLFAGLYLLLNCRRPDRLASSVLAALLLSLLALSKGTLLILTTGIIGLVALQAALHRDRRRPAVVAGTFVLGVLGWWLLARQDPRNLPGFAHGVSELSRGYNEAMGLNEPTRAFVSGLAALLALEGLVLLLAWRRRHDSAGVAGALLLGAFHFLKWKHGFVRADGHVFIYYQYALAAAPTTWLLFPAPPAGKRRAWLAPAVLAAVAMGCAIYGPGDDPLFRLRWQLARTPPRTLETFQSVLHPAAAKRVLEHRLAQNHEDYSLPDIQDTVGRAAIDFFGFEHGYLVLNGLNYRPRPMGGGSFNVFTPFLQEANAAFIRDPARRPEYYLLNLQTIDNRFLAADDGVALRALLEGYQPVTAEQGMLLLRAVPGPVRPAPPRELLRRSFRYGETVGLPVVGPDEMILASFRLPPSFVGRVRSALYKPSHLYLSLSGDGLRDPESRRLVPSMVERPVIFSPVLEQTLDLLGLYSREPGKVLHSFRLTAQRPQDFAADRFEVVFYAVPRPPALPAAVRTRLAGPLTYLVANRPPVAIVPPNQPMRVFDGRPVQMVETPGQMVFALEPTDRVVTFGYGMDPECYTRGKTDGIDIYVTLDQPGAPPSQLFRRPLHPLTVAADRGSHHLRLVLPPVLRPGARLVLHTDPGPAGDSAWDWAYFAGIRFEGGPYLAEQFPGFNVAPDEVTGDYCGSLGLADGRTVFMLNAPGSLAFRLDGHARVLSFRAGLVEGAYTEGNTDGADFVVELRHADGRSEELGRRRLRPKSVAADRGPQALTVTLPAPAAGDRLVLRTTAGPGADYAWDWCYVEGLTLK
ncbi:MAG: hypothetical protein JSR48_02895 [Verrucomicrobia bacterium]|nr:hypothetical protein [Verrucomicrobiota bacterium]